MRAGTLIVGQTANILLLLGSRHSLAPASEAGRLCVHQLQLTLADLVAGVHDTHHLVSSRLYYEGQMREAQRRSRDFLDTRVPKFRG